MKSIKFILLVILFLLGIGGVAMSIPLQKIYLKSTVYIKNEFGNVGTGFLIAKERGGNYRAVFVITNKHILKQDEKGEFAKFINVRFYAKDPKKAIVWVKIPILRDDGRFTEAVFMHPQEEVDVVGILVSSYINKNEDIDPKFFGEGSILTREIAQKECIDAGEDLLILGYPGGIFSENNYLPIVKSGLLASSSSEDLYLKLRNKEFKGKIYLIEASLFGGNSGGPVFVKVREKVKREEDGFHQEVQIGTYIPLYLLGVQSSSIQLTEKIYTRVFAREDNNKVLAKENLDKKVVIDVSGEYFETEKEIMLNIVFSAEYIKDIFDSFLKWDQEKKAIQSPEATTQPHP